VTEGTEFEDVSEEAVVDQIESSPQSEVFEPEIQVEEPEPTIIEELEAADTETQVFEAPVTEEPVGEVATDVVAVAEEPASGTDPGQTDDLTAAIRQANENLDTEPTLGDIAPCTVIHEDPTETSEEDAEEEVHHYRRGEHKAPSKGDSVSLWPFAIYDVIWLAFGIALVYKLQTVPATQALYEAALYPMTVMVGVGLTVLGLVVMLGTWMATWNRPGSTKGGLFFSALMKGSVSIVIGVAIWWIALIVLDQLRLGSAL
jgi:hypothetical protein